MLTTLEVIDGMGNNSFQPDGNVTRAQMAKMITIISLGNVDPSAFLGTTTDLKDINGHWAKRTSSTATARASSPAAATACSIPTPT